MKLILDQGLPRTAINHLAAAGIAAEHVGNIGMHAATDDQILELARNEGATVVTLDADFHRLLAASKANAPSVIRVRIEGLKGDRLAALLVRLIATVGDELAKGAVVSVTDSRIRVRALPIGR
jgi:predicted nuclease of predicted toxin-antitoxin system